VGGAAALFFWAKGKIIKRTTALEVVSRRWKRKALSSFCAFKSKYEFKDKAEENVRLMILLAKWTNYQKGFTPRHLQFLSRRCAMLC